MSSITCAAIRPPLPPGALPLISTPISAPWRAFCLHYYFLPLFSPSVTKNPLAIVATVAFLITAWVITGMVARVRKLTEAQLALRFEERLAERTRIARELHDTF